MKTVVLIACVSKKLSRPAPAGELYTSDLFKKNMAYAKQLKPAAIYILSAKHGLLPLQQEIEPYNQTLNAMKMPAVKLWAQKVIRQLEQHIDKERDKVVFLAGMRYRKFLLSHIKHTAVPLKGLGIGRQLQFLKHALH